MGNSLLNQFQQLKQQGPANVVFDKMYQNNPQFKQFADSMQGKTPQQAFSEYGLDFNRFKNFKW
jgi:hypothetical protein